MATASREIAEFHLRGEGVQVVLKFNDADEMELEYNGRVFSGGEVKSESTVLGLLASVLVEAQPDNYTRYLTVIVPETHCGRDTRPVPVITFAVLTTKQTTIAGPELVAGQVDSYRVVSPLTGTAR